MNGGKAMINYQLSIINDQLEFFIDCFYVIVTDSSQAQNDTMLNVILRRDDEESVPDLWFFKFDIWG
jgi:hypothetical protein